MGPFPEEEFAEYTFEMFMSIHDVKSLYGIVCFALETWPGSPRRPVEEQEYLLKIKTQLFAMIADYSFSELDADK